MEYVHSSRARPPLPPGPFLVVGLARSGVAVAKALKAHGQEVSGVDSGRPADLSDLDLAGIPHETDSTGLASLSGVGTLVKSPGVPKEAEVVLEARRLGIPVVGELEIGWRLVHGAFVGITGTNGKTTTTELVAHVLRTAGRPVHAVGNIGSPLSALAEGHVDADSTVVCECSSFQLEDIEYFGPECAVYLNLAPDHLDRHGTMEEYGRIKQRIFMNQIEGDVAILNEADPVMSGFDPPGEASVIRFLPAGQSANPVDVTIQDGAITVDGRPLLEVSDLKLIGAHNIANAMAAAAAALSLGLPPEVVAEGLLSFTGVAHRLEPVAELSGVQFVNDSKATNVEATVTALGSFDSGIRLILGGSLKGESFVPLVKAVRASCTGVYLIGESAAAIREALTTGGAEGVAIEECGDLEAAVSMAWADALEGEAVLLSPSCASFDQFRDYEDRGDRFRGLVEAIDVV